MFVSFMVMTKKAGQGDLIIERFTKFTELTRDMEIRRQSGRSKDVGFAFKTDDIKPFFEFAKSLSKESDLVRYDIEFSYDDGEYHFYRVEKGQLVNIEEISPDKLRDAFMVLEDFTGIRDNVDKLLRIWANEIKPSPQDLQKKREDLCQGKTYREQWERMLDEKFQKRVSKTLTREADTVDEIPTVPEKVQAPIYPKGRKAILDLVHNLNTSGNVFIPLVVFPNEISSKLSPEGLTKFASYFVKTEEKGKIFSMILDAFKRHKEI